MIIAEFMDSLYYERLLNSALRFISYRPRSEKELRDFLSKKLTKWKVSGKLLLEKVVARMGELGYIDDDKFAEWWVEQRTKNKPKGKRIIKQELLRKGVDKELLEEHVSNRNEKLLAKKAVQKIAAKIQKLPVLEKKKKIFSYLSYRGFDSETIMSLIDEIVGKGYNKEEDLNEDT